jgi:hypothetical protein
MLIYYCYSCTEYFKISPKKAKSQDNVICPQCGSFDTEHSPEEENSPETSKYVQANISDDDDTSTNEFDAYMEEVEGAEDI